MVKRIELKDKKLTSREFALNEKLKYSNMSNIKGKFKGKELNKYKKLKEETKLNHKKVKKRKS
jgi:hypothetical protein